MILALIRYVCIIFIFQVDSFIWSVISMKNNHLYMLLIEITYIKERNRTEHVLFEEMCDTSFFFVAIQVLEENN